MTNHWNDIDNTSLVFAYGANPAENHPACMAHVNAARFSTDFGTKRARLIVVDPRLTRTALQCDPTRGDRFVRIRPGTNVAFTNGLMKWIFDNIATYDATASTNMLAWHNGTAANSTNYTTDSTKARTFVANNGATLSPVQSDWNTAAYDVMSGTPLATGYPKYCDTRFVLNAAGDDYARGTLTLGTGLISEFPVIAPTVTSSPTVGGVTMQTVWTSLQQHLLPYDSATVADICGCTAADIEFVAKALIDNSRFKSVDFGASAATPKGASVWPNATAYEPTSGYKVTTILYAMGQTQHTNGSQNIKDLAIIQTLLGNMGRPGGGINALRGIHNVQGSTDMGLLYDAIPAYGDNPGKSDITETFGHYLNGQFGNRLQGITVAAKAAVTIRGAAASSGVIYTAKTAGTAGNSITIQYLIDVPGAANTLTTSVSGNAHVVHLGTDSGGVVTSTAADIIANVLVYATPADILVVPTLAAAAGTGKPDVKAATSLTGGTAAGADLSNVIGKLGLQQRGFYNMTTEFFGNGLTASGADVEKLYNLWPKGDGVQHIKTFRNMTLPLDDANRIISAVCWGQNPAVTEPNQSKVRAGLKNLDLLVVVDMFETETAACDRKSLGVTYLIPACSHVEEAGSATNSGRWLQWRERACAPKGNSKADLELLLRFAYALDKASVFSHITNVAYNGASDAVPTSGVWSTLTSPGVGNNGVISGPAYKALYGDKYGWTPGTATKFEAVPGTTERWAPGTAPPITNYAAVGSEVVAEAIYKEMCRPTNKTTTSGGTMWIYSGADTGAADLGGGATPGVGGYNDGVSYNGNYMPAVTSAGNTVAWQVKNRAKSRNNVVTGADGTVGANNYPRWGWAWLLNRRVFYNNGEVSGDQSDTFVAPGLVALTYTAKNPTPGELGLADWSLVYRKYKTFKDTPSTTVGPHFLDQVNGGKTFMGRFPGHTEPYESPAVASNPAFKADYVALFGHNMSAGTRLIVVTVGDATPVGDYGTTVGKFPLVLTSIRCVEHFQGGPITRNNTWNVEAEPTPWIEINSVDAAAHGISDGDWVNVTTARGNSGASQMALSQDGVYTRSLTNPVDNFGLGFKARVGAGLQSNQRVAPGLVAIPWHWGDKGLSTGSRANDLCIDAWDANTTIPEYKACLCNIEKM